APSEAGRPVIRNFTQRDYNGHHQVFALAQGPNGLMYFSVFAQVLEFDGHDWRRISVPTSWIRGLAAAPDGRIFVAGTDEVGFIAPGPDGLPAYQSLRSKIPAGQQPLGNVWRTAWHDGAAWFATSRLL